MTSYLPLIHTFMERTCMFWPPEAFTLDCRVEERIYEWCERTLKTNSDFLALVNSQTPLDMQGLWMQMDDCAYSSLTKCVFHYWLILNWRSHKEGKPFCRENADWIWRQLKIESPMAWHAEHPPASEEEMKTTYTALHAAASAAAAAATAAAAMVAGSYEPDPAPARLGTDVSNMGSAPKSEPIPEPAPAPPQKDVKTYVTVGNTMYGIRLSDLPRMEKEELRIWYRRLCIAQAECWSAEECDTMEILLEAINQRLGA